METVNNNKAIAIFMGGKTSDMDNRIVQGYQNIWLPVHGVCRWDTAESGKGKILQYHKSWDWLIPVIDKIRNHGSYAKYIDRTGNDGGVHIDTGSVSNTYNNVVDFIHFYFAQCPKN